MRWIAKLAAGLLSLAGCGDDDNDDWLDDDWFEDYTFVRAGDHVTVYGYDLAESDACAGSFAATERHTGAVMEFLGIDDLDYDYRWLSPEAWPGTCPIDASACASHGQPRTRALPDMHEIVHAVVYALPEGGCASMLEEGLAEYLGGPRYWSAPLTEHDIGEELDDFRISGHFYARAGHFVSYLIERYGAEGFIDLCRALPLGSDLAAWAGASEAVLDTSLDELLADYREYPECRQWQYRERLWECSGEPDFVFSAENPTVEFTADCSDSRAMNSRPGQVVITRRVFMPEPITGAVTVIVEGADGEKRAFLRRFMSQECAPCSADPQVFRDVDGLPIYTYRPGMHEFVLFLDAATDKRVTLTLDRPP